MTQSHKTPLQTYGASCGLEQYRPELHRFLNAFLRGSPETEDLLQDVYLRFLQSPHKNWCRQLRPSLTPLRPRVLSQSATSRQPRPATRKWQRKDGRHAAGDAWRIRRARRFNPAPAFDPDVSQAPKTYRTILAMRLRTDCRGMRSRQSSAFRRRLPNGICRMRLAHAALRNRSGDARYR